MVMRMMVCLCVCVSKVVPAQGRHCSVRRLRSSMAWSACVPETSCAVSCSPTAREDASSETSLRGENSFLRLGHLLATISKEGKPSTQHQMEPWRQIGSVTAAFQLHSYLHPFNWVQNWWIISSEERVQESKKQSFLLKTTCLSYWHPCNQCLECSLMLNNAWWNRENRERAIWEEKKTVLKASYCRFPWLSRLRIQSVL